MTSTYRTARGLHGARVNLGRFVIDLAQETEDTLAFGYVAIKDAPASAQQLIAAYEHSTRTGEPFPVSSLYCESTIFTEPLINHAYRFVHDCSHRRLGLSFTLEDEWHLGTYHLEQATKAGLGPGTLEYELLRCDIFGQLILLGIAGRFPIDQGVFALECVEKGIEAGVLAELRRIP